MPDNQTDSVPSLYVHVPFCAHKCEYCAFFSTPPLAGQVDAYLEALSREIIMVRSQLQQPPSTIFIGGGTPSLLTIEQWKRLLGCLSQQGLLGAREWTVECNPATVSAEKARLWRDYGINRISLGVQSLDDSLLERLGRVHSRAMVFQTYDLLRQAGFDNLNVDLMFGIPSQTLAIWRSTMQEAMALQPEHVSCYEVIYEEDTPLYEQLNAKEFSVDESLACAMYEELLEHTAARHYHQYEVANFARHQGASGFRIPDRACKHNVNYWRGGFFLGLGPSASSYTRGVRTKNWANTGTYCEHLAQGRRAIQSEDCLPDLGRAAEIAGFGLRMPVGWEFEEFKNLTGYDLRGEWVADIKRLTDLGYGILDAKGFRLSQLGLRYADWAVELFLRP